MIPTLSTNRLILRAPRREDFLPFAAFWASGRSVYEGGPRDMSGAWDDFAAGFGLWTINGLGTWAVQDRASGALAGVIGYYHPAAFPELEIGWTLLDGFEGKGLAFEAAMAAREWGYREKGLATLVSYIDPANARSIRLAERMGARRDLAAPGIDQGDVVMRHPGADGTFRWWS
ncbi:MAG: GNAT family N-acetyltransferase [Rhodobacter sp.]|jgi:RimJ/RimL family protein N-acetyltransferase|nr:GNAT family N-acetyltransferase [Rhodobacter sp.]